MFVCLFLFVCKVSITIVLYKQHQSSDKALRTYSLWDF